MRLSLQPQGRHPQLLVALSLASDALDDRLLEQACWLAERCAGEVRLAHVVEGIDLERRDAEAQLGARVARAERLLSERCEAVRARGMVASAVVAAGQAWYELLREAWHWPADLLVLGPHVPGTGLLERVLHGSTARRILRKAPMPVWMVGPQGLRGIRRMLVAVDLSPISAQLVALANHLHALAGVERVLLHCLDLTDDLAINMRADAHELIEACHQELAREAKHRIDALLGDARQGWEVVLGAAWVVRVAPHVLREHDCDLVAVASMKQAPTIAGKLLGTTAEKLVEGTHASVWVERPFDWSSPVTFAADDPGS